MESGTYIKSKWKGMGRIHVPNHAADVGMGEGIVFTEMAARIIL
jgi:hypothetical protein